MGLYKPGDFLDECGGERDGQGVEWSKYWATEKREGGLRHRAISREYIGGLKEDEELL